MQQFIFIFRGGNTHVSTAQSQAEMDMIQTWNVWMGGLAQQGMLTGGDALKTSGKYVSSSEKIVSDGTYGEGDEMVGGYLIINAKDLDDAIEISKGCPILSENGSVEVRQIQER